MMFSFLRLMRVYYGGPLAGGFLVILLYRSGIGGIDVGLAGGCFFSLFCIISAGYVFNDVCDVEVDRVNCPGRVLAAGQVRRGAAKIWGGILAGLGMVSAAFCGLWFFAGVGAILAGLICYDMCSKRVGVLKDFMVAGFMVCLYPLSLTVGHGGGERAGVLFIHPVWIFLSSFGYEVFKDVRDMAGDAAGGGERRFGRWVLPVARAGIVAGGVVTLVPFLMGYCGYVYLGGAGVGLLLSVLGALSGVRAGIRFIYAEIFIVTVGSFLDLLVCGG